MSSKVSSRQGSWQSRQAVDAKKKTNAPHTPALPSPSPRPPAVRVSPRVASRQGAWQSHQATDAKKGVAIAPPVSVVTEVPQLPMVASPTTDPVALVPPPDPELISRLVDEAVERRMAEQIPVGAPVRPSRVMGRFGVKPAGD